MRRVVERYGRRRPRWSFLRVMVAAMAVVAATGVPGAAAAMPARVIPSTVTVTATPNPVTVGQPETLQANVVCDALLPTGTASFFDGVVLLGVVPLAGGTATLVSSAFTVGAHSITVIYNGDINCDPAAGGTVLNVNKAASTASVTAAPNPAMPGEPVTLTATVACGFGTPTGTVQFFDGVTPLGVAVLAGGTGTFTTSTLTEGSHQITAAYGGDGNCNAATSAPVTVTVSRGATTTTLQTYPARPRRGGQLLLIAHVTCASGQPTGSVTFRDNGRVLATSPLLSQRAEWIIFRVTAGHHSITATYNGDAGCGPTTSSPVSFTIRAGLDP